MRGAVVSALLLTLAQPPFHVPLLPFLALAPFAVAVARLPAGRAREAALAGGVLGALHFALLLHWMPVALWRHDPATAPLYGVVVGALALLLAAAGWLLYRLGRAGAPMALALPLAWTAAEWLRAEAAGPLAFPWLGLGATLAATPEWAGVAEWVGERGLSLWLAAVSGLLADAWLARGGPRVRGAPEDASAGTGDDAAPRAGTSAARRWLPSRSPSVLAAFAVVLAAAPVAWGVHRAATLPTRVVGEAVLVQTGVPVGPDVDGRIALTLEALDAVTSRVAPGASVVVLPEMVVPVPLADPRARPLVAALVHLAAQAGGPVMFGAPGAVVSEAGDTAVRNSVLVAAPWGIFPARYDKRALVPGVEATSLLRLGWPGAPPEGYQAGVDHALLRVGAGHWGPLVCWEAAFPGVSRGLRRTGADVLVNVTNDGWIAGTGGMSQHPAHLTMRAIETRAGAVRAATTGLTLVIDPTGRVRAAAVPGQGLLIDYQVVVDIRAFEYTAEGAAAELAQALEADPRSAAGAALLDDLLLDRGAHADRVARLEARGEEDPAGRSEAWWRAAQIASEQLRDFPRARALYEKAAGATDQAAREGQELPIALAGQDRDGHAQLVQTVPDRLHHACAQAAQSGGQARGVVAQAVGVGRRGRVGR
ncbi:MAG: apolipoprotein N-acyltransferase [Gemmatimonadetes bacterium]|nr:apolipoprotein N-acyltransferase [Gemmatimonadota bacterium]